MTKILRNDLIKISNLIQKNEKVLDVGCGDGNLIYYLSKNKNVNCRGIEITLKGVGWAFQCANKLLEDGVIDYIAFFTESEKTVSMARALISSGYKDKLIVPGKSYVNDTEKHIDSMDMRDPGEMETAVSEWLCKINVY